MLLLLSLVDLYLLVLATADNTNLSIPLGAKDFDTIAAPGGFTCPPDKPIRFTAPTLRNRYERNIVMLVCSLTLMLLR